MLLAMSKQIDNFTERAFDESVDEGAGSALLGSRLHDFGFRGCTGVEQSVRADLTMQALTLFLFWV